MKIWGFEISRSWLDSNQLEYLSTVPVHLPSVEWLWNEMDRIWSSFALNGKTKFDKQTIMRYYSHPVWLLNGIFTATDPASVMHRKAIAKYLSGHGVLKVADYGGGFGELARTMSMQNHDLSIDIVEPFPTSVAKNLNSNFSNIRFVYNFDGLYDAVIAQDILEHIEDPVGLAIEMAQVTKPGGLLVFANCFYPVIQCHLPQTFFLRHTFKYIMTGLGLDYIGVIQNAEHVLVFRKTKELNAARCRNVETLAKVMGPILNVVHSFIHAALKKVGRR